MKKFHVKKAAAAVCLMFLAAYSCFPWKKKNREKSSSGVSTESQNFQKAEPENLAVFREAYPDVQFSSSYDSEKSDWKIEIRLPEETESSTFYWCNGSLLPEKELGKTGKYWTLLYSYPKELKDPASMTEEEKARLKEFSSRTNRREGLGTPMFFFETLYKSASRAELERRLTASTFLGKKTTVHRRIAGPLKRTEDKILEAAKTSADVQSFVEGLNKADAYNWRVIDGTSRKSFHSLGIAIDVLPKKISGEIFWSWARDKNPGGWMLTPLSRRWLPPKAVVEIFESEGFIWGGKWGIWDNMHFEYHPELILFNRITEK